MEAIVMLHDHLHAIWTPPPNDTDYSKRWGTIKKHYTQSWLAPGVRKIRSLRLGFATAGAASGNLVSRRKGQILNFANRRFSGFKRTIKMQHWIFWCVM